MTDEPRPQPAASKELQFDQVEYAAGTPAATCAVCQQPIQGSYYEVNGAVFCAGCREALGKALVGGSRAGRAVKATLLGSGAAVIGMAIYYVVLLATNINFAL